METTGCSYFSISPACGTNSLPRILPSWRKGQLLLAQPSRAWCYTRFYHHFPARVVSRSNGKGL